MSPARPLATLALVAIALCALPAAAQSPFSPGATPAPGPGPAPTQSGPSAQQQAELGGAASGGEHPSQLPTEAPQLPENPNAIPKPIKQKIGSDFDPDRVERGRGRTTKYHLYGPYYEEVSGGYLFRAIFPPVWMERRQQVPGGVDRGSLFGLHYFNRRSPRHDADILFPLFWHLRDDQTYTTAFVPFFHQHGPEGHDNWLAPLFFEGSRKTGTEYLHIPPLLVFHHRDKKGGFSMVGPAYCYWKGGSFCDGRTATTLDMGVAPFYFYGRDERTEYDSIPLLLHFYRYTEKDNHWLDIWGPVWREKDREGSLFNVLPLFYHHESDKGSSTTFVPLFHYSNNAGTRLTATPLFFYRSTPEGESTFGSWLYARHRGRTELDMVSPLVWLYRDPDLHQSTTVAFPFVYRNASNRSDDLAVFPFFGHFHRYGLSNSYWVTPLFNYESDIAGWSTTLLPIFFAGRTNDSNHLVIAPLVWDFAAPQSRQTVVFPIYWRFADTKTITQVVGNTFYYEEKTEHGTEWQFHLFPLLSFGVTPDGHWWKLLYGLAGYTREGTMAKMQLAYIPIELSKKER